MERLTARQGRVVASLVEKHLTTPQLYPLTLNALVAACNQSTNRDPVTAFAEHDVLEAVESLKAKRMVRAVLPSHGRTAVRYRHVLDEVLGLDAPQLAVLAVLELRGPQTSAELRVRTERMAAADSVDHELDLLAGRVEPLVERVGRRPGQKEDRWASLLAEPSTAGEREDIGERGAVSERGSVGERGDIGERGAVRGPGGIEGLRRELDGMRAELDSLRAQLEAIREGLEDLRSSLGG